MIQTAPTGHIPHPWSYRQERQRLARMERRQAKLTNGEPRPYVHAPFDLEKERRLWAAVLREHRG